MIRRAVRSVVRTFELWALWRRYRQLRRDLERSRRVQVPVTLVRAPAPYRVPERGNRAQA